MFASKAHLTRRSVFPFSSTPSLLTRPYPGPMSRRGVNAIHDEHGPKRLASPRSPRASSPRSGEPTRVSLYSPRSVKVLHDFETR